MNPIHDDARSLIDQRRNRQRLAESLSAKAQAILDAAEADGQRELTGEESLRIGRLMDETDAHLAKIGELDAEIDARRSAGRRSDPDPIGGAPSSSAHRLYGGSAAGGSLSQKLFAKSGRQHERTSFRSFAEFAHVIASGRSHPELFNAAGMNEGVGGDGGFAVPAAFSGALFDLIGEQSLFLQRATVTPFGGASNINFPVFD